MSKLRQLSQQKTNYSYSIEQKIEAELVRILYSNIQAAFIGKILTAACVVIALHDTIASQKLWNWIFVIAVFSVFRILSVILYHYAKPSCDKTNFWRNIFVFMTFISGIIWMLLSTYLMGPDLQNELIVAFAVAGVAAGSVAFLSASRLSAISFLVLLLLSFTMQMLMMPGIQQQLIACLAGIYFFTLLALIMRNNREIRAALRLKFENEELIYRLRSSKNEIEIINAELQVEIKERMDFEKLLRLSEEQYRLVTDALPVLIAYIDKNLHFRFNNKAYAEWFNKPLAHISGTPVEKLFDAVVYGSFQDHFIKTLEGVPVTYETAMYTHDEQERFVNVTLIPHKNEGKVVGAFSLISDMTSRINYLATHDPLTSLPNRSLLNVRLTHALRHAEKSGAKVALLFLDLDHFKNVNDTLGHDVGDQLLIKMVERLKKNVRDGDTIARLGGDEFIIILEDYTDIEAVNAVAKKICFALSQVITLKDRDLFITTSIGISIYPDDGNDMRILMKNADMAMYRAKERGRNTFEFYTSYMNDAIQKKVVIESHLRSALDRDELKVHYQPIINISKNQIVGLEALLRWNNFDLGTVAPKDFIPIAEETDLIVPIGEWVLRTACKQLLFWHRKGFPDLTIAINLSVRQFLQNGFVELIKRILHETGLDGKYLTLELTESLIMEDIDFSLKIVRELKELDITISIDDFGTGYSSLSYLKRFPFDVIKIDHSFVTDFAFNPGDAAIVRAIITLAHNLKMKVVAEGVEKFDQYLFLKAHSCDEVQGYFFKPALPEMDISTVLEYGLIDLRNFAYMCE